MQQVEIRVKGHINKDWANRLFSLQIAHTSEGNTVLSGSLRDQAELQGMLSRLGDLGLELISVNTSAYPRD
jgi:hypothetical protein